MDYFGRTPQTIDEAQVAHAERDQEFNEVLDPVVVFA
jgi:exonuclease I